MTKIFIANLPYHITAEQITRLFEMFGAVALVRILTQSPEGKSRGYGFVEMTDETEANRAIEKLDGQEIDGRKMVVQVSGQHTGKRPRLNAIRGRAGQDES